MTADGKIATGAGLWNAIDRIYCISVDAREDRRESAAAQFRRIGILPRVEFVIVARHPEDCEQGIYESHLTCMKKGIEAGAKTLAIFEDDILFDRYSMETMKNCTEFLAQNPEWDVLFLGCLVYASRRTGNRSVLKVKYRSLAHGYMINGRFAERILRKPWNHMPFDAMLSALPGRYFAAYPSLAFQSNAPTDNTRYPGLDRFRRWCGGLRRIQKMNEFFHRHRPLIIALHGIVILGLLWLLV